MNDNGVGLVALDHADVEETGIFAVHGVMHDGALAVTMILGRLDHADFRIGERRHQILQPVRPHRVIGIDDADDLGICRRVRKREPQRARFVSGDIIRIDELETFTERAAMILDRAPKRRVGRVIDDDDAFEVRIIEPGDGIERRLEHVRRLTMGRNMDRNLRCETVGRGQGRRDQPARPRPKAIAAISSMRASAIATSGMSRTMPSTSAKAAPSTK